MKASEIYESVKYNEEVREKWGNTEAFSQYEEKTDNYSKDKWNALADTMNCIMSEFADCMKMDLLPSSDTAIGLVQKLQDYITENYYNCTDEILSGLGKMYVADERFRSNIDRNGEGTAEFINKAIECYCRK